MMKTVLKTAPAAEPVSAADCKTHLNIEVLYLDDNPYIDTLISTARHYAEQITQRRFITQTWLLYLDEWPDSDELLLPFGSLSSVTSVKYYETDDTENTMSATEYGVDTDSRVGRIILDYGESWPTETLRPLNPVKIEFVCGYGAAGSSVPQPIIQALKIMVADAYSHRATGMSGSISIKIKTSMTIDNLLRPYRLWYP